MNTGVPGLDELLGGGLLPCRSLLLKGPPGSAKTTLGLQMLISAAERGEPGIFLTFEQLPEQLIADTADFGWDINALADRQLLKVFFITPDEILQNPGRQDNRLAMRIEEWTEQVGAHRILIDSISHIPQLTTGENVRSAFMNFILRLKALGLTPILTSEYNDDREQSDIDVYIADSVIYLRYDRGGIGRPEARQLEIIKTRGHKHVGGAHPMEIGSAGITIYPHTYPDMTAPAGDSDAAVPRLATGVPGLDDLLDGGLAKGSSILAAGLSGTFKTTLAAQFLLAGIKDDQPGLMIAFQQDATALCKSMAGLGPDISQALDDGKLHILELVPGRDQAEKTFYAAAEIIEANGIRRVVIDSADELTAARASEEECKETMLWFLRRLRALGTTVLFTQRLSSVSGRNPLSDIAMTDLADTIIFLGLVEIESRLEKVVSVLKHRGGKTDGDLRSICRTPLGLEICDRFIGLSGVLEGTAMGQRKEKIEKIFQPLYFIRDFLKMARDPSIDADKRNRVLENISQQNGKLIEVMGEYFDDPKKKESQQASDSNPGSKA